MGLHVSEKSMDLYDEGSANATPGVRGKSKSLVGRLVPIALNLIRPCARNGTGRVESVGWFANHLIYVHIGAVAAHVCRFDLPGLGQARDRCPILPASRVFHALTDSW